MFSATHVAVIRGRRLINHPLSECHFLGKFALNYGAFCLIVSEASDGRLSPAWSELVLQVSLIELSQGFAKQRGSRRTSDNFRGGWFFDLDFGLLGFEQTGFVFRTGFGLPSRIHSRLDLPRLADTRRRGACCAVRLEQDSTFTNVVLRRGRCLYTNTVSDESWLARKLAGTVIWV